MSESTDSTKTSISDPYYGDIENFEQVFQQLDQVCSLIAKKLLKNTD